MAFTLTPALAFVGKVSTITAATANYWRVSISQAIDGAAGGAYTPTSAIEIGGTQGLKLSATGAGEWLQLGSRTVTIGHPLALATVVHNVGPGGNVPSALIQDSDVTSAIGGLTVAQPAIASPVGALNSGEASYFIAELVRPPDGATLVSVSVNSKGVGTFGTVPQYTIVKWGTSTTPAGPVAISAVDQADTHIVGNWTTILAQTINANASTVVDLSANRYGLLVKNAFQAGGASALFYVITANYTVTSMRY